MVKKEQKSPWAFKFEGGLENKKPLTIKSVSLEE